MKKPKQPRSPKLTDAERDKRFVETAKKVEASDKIEDFDRAFNGLDIKAPFVGFKPTRRSSPR
jgi:hypothetical protein